MKLFNEKQKRGNSSRLPLTLAAAVIAIAFVGGLLFFIQRASTPSLQQQTNCEFNGRTIPYVIEEGDTLFSVAGAFRTTATRLTVANCLDYDVPDHEKRARILYQQAVCPGLLMLCRLLHALCMPAYNFPVT